MVRWTTEVRKDREVFSELGDWWDVQEVPSLNPFMRSRVLACWEGGVDDEGSERRVLVLRRSGDPVAAIPCYRYKGRLRSMGKNFGDAFDVVAVDDPEVRRRVPRWVDSFPVLHAFSVPRKSLLIDHAVGEPRWKVVAAGVIPEIDLAGGIDGVRNAVASGFAKSLRRRRRRLHELGDVEFVDLVPTSSEDPLLQAGLALEAAGWKGPAQQAVLTDPERQRWYEPFLEVSIAEGWLRVSGLFLDGRLLASSCDLVFGDRRFGLLSAYDEAQEVARLSPGNLLLEDILATAEAEGTLRYDLGLGDEPWKADWASGGRRVFDLVVHGSGPRGRMVHLLRKGSTTSLTVADA